MGKLGLALAVAVEDWDRSPMFVLKIVSIVSILTWNFFFLFPFGVGRFRWLTTVSKFMKAQSKSLPFH